VAYSSLGPCSCVMKSRWTEALQTLAGRRRGLTLGLGGRRALPAAATALHSNHMFTNNSSLVKPQGYPGEDLAKAFKRLRAHACQQAKGTNKKKAFNLPSAAVLEPAIVLTYSLRPSPGGRGMSESWWSHSG
jgi:hypothetical protein